VALYGVSARHIPRYEGMGLRAICVGEEAVLDPAGFTLEGRAVRKLRQSVHRVQRRGWQITACEGREIHAALEAEIDALEASWRSTKRHLLGFAMGHGGIRVGRAAGGSISACPLTRRCPARRDAVHLPLREAVAGHDAACRRNPQRAQRGAGLPSARDRARAGRHRGQPQLRRARPPRSQRALVRVVGESGRAHRRRVAGAALSDAAVDALQREVQPEWRPRYLVYESGAALPRSLFRVLQAEGYLPQRKRPRRDGDPSRSGLQGLASVKTRVEARLDR
jgi:lysyl-tRNA synthetase, class II